MNALGGFEGKIVINGADGFAAKYELVKAVLGEDLVPGGKMDGRPVTKKQLVNKMPVRRALFDMLTEAIDCRDECKVESLRAMVSKVNGTLGEEASDGEFVSVDDIFRNIGLLNDKLDDEEDDEFDEEDELDDDFDEWDDDNEVDDTVVLGLVDYYVHAFKREFPADIKGDDEDDPQILKDFYPVFVDMVMHDFAPHGWVEQEEFLTRIGLRFSEWAEVRKEVERRLGGGFRRYRSMEDPEYRELLHIAWEVAEAVCKAMRISFEETFPEFKIRPGSSASSDKKA